MLLSDKDLREAIEEDRIKLIPFKKELIGPSSIDLRLSEDFRSFKPSTKTCIDPRKGEDPSKYTERTELEDGFFSLHPNEFVLGATMERVELGSDIAAKIQGRSSLGRLGIVIQTAGWVDPGFRGDLTLEIINFGKVPVKLYPRMRICQLTFFETKSETETPYDKRKSSKYIDQRGASPSLIHRDEEFKEEES